MNSRLPLILLVLTTIAAVWLVRGNTPRGVDGPQIEPGILRLPVKESRKVAAEPLTPAITITGDPLESSAWRVWMIAGDDREAATRALMLGLAERLTERGCIAVIAPKPKPDEAATEALPLGADVRLGISAVTPATPVAGQPWATTWTMQIAPFHLPAEHPATRLLPDGANGPAATTWTVTFASPGPGDAWPAWWAAVGRNGADALLGKLGRTTVVDDTTARIRHMAWLPAMVTPGPGAAPLEPEHGRIPSPPQADIAEKLLAFQFPLVRGWTGVLSPVPVTSAERGTKTAREELDRRLTKDALWTKQETNGQILYTKAGPVPVLLSLDATGNLVLWQERPSPATVVKGWRDSSDPLAKDQLERHRHTPGIPADLRLP